MLAGESKVYWRTESKELWTASEAMAKAWNCIGVIMRGTSRSLKATAHQGRGSVTWRIASGRREREGMDAGIGAKATAWTAWGAMAKASAHRCKRDMAWSEDAGRERPKAWMQASRHGGDHAGHVPVLEGNCASGAR